MLLQTRPSPIPRLAALVLCATVALGACSSGDDDSADSTSPTSEATSEGSTEAEAQGDGDVTDALESAAPTGTIDDYSVIPVGPDGVGIACD